MSTSSTKAGYKLFKVSWTCLCLAVFLFSHFWHHGQYITRWWTVSAAWTTPKTDLVAIIVDNVIYPSIQGDLAWYTNTYIPAMSPWTRALVIPITTEWFYAPDIQKILANLYFEWQKGVPSQLVGVILFGDVPLPIVDIEGKRFASIYPYVDFEDPMFRYDIVSDVFVFDNRPDSLPELRHSIIPSRDVWLFTQFFSKLREYFASPVDYAKPMIWYDDFIMMNVI